MNQIQATLLLLMLILGCSADESAPAAESSVPETQADAAPAEEIAPAPVDEPDLDNPTAGDLLPQPFEVIWEPWAGGYEGMVERRFVRVVVPYGGYQFYYDGGKPRGAIYELLQRFETYINKEMSRRHIRVYVVIIPVSRDQLIPAVINGNADIVAGDLTITDVRSLMVDFSKPVRTNINEIVVAGRDAQPMSSIRDLAGAEVFLRRSSSYFEHMQELAVEFQRKDLSAPVLRVADELLESEDILEMLDGGLAKLTVMDDYKAKYWSSVFPNLTIRDDLVVSEGRDIAWAVRKESPELLAVINAFLREFGRGTLIGNDTYNRYLASAKRVRCIDNQLRTESATELVENFQKYGETFDFDWLMLAAQGLQESGLRQNRRSPAGAIGVMQIKPSTAADKHIGIDDVTSVENNIHAGSKYLRFVADRYYSSDGFDDLNSWLFSLAAYNAGPAKINRYRSEAAEKGYDPNRWFDNVEIIAARRIGRETVSYVSNIFKYYVGYQLVNERIAIHEDRFDEILTGCSSPG